MSYVTGWNSIRIKTTDQIKFLIRCANAVTAGYELHKRTIKRDWPRFWRKRYKAEYRKYYIIDDSKIAYFSKEHIDYIVTGRLK